MGKLNARDTVIMSVAHHEAGHAVASLVLELPFVHVTIAPCLVARAVGDEGGHVKIDDPLRGLNFNCILAPEDIAKVERFMVVLLAGYFGCLLTGEDKETARFGANEDFQRAKYLASVLARQLSPLSEREHLSQAIMRADILVDINAEMVENLAVALFEATTLNLEQSVAALDNSILEAQEHLKLFWD